MFRWEKPGYHVNRGTGMNETPNGWNDYYTQHGMWGAYASLVLGKRNEGAGFVLGDVKPPQTGMYVGYRVASCPPCLFPFLGTEQAGLGSSAYTGKDDTPAPAPYTVFSQEEITRVTSLGSETWKAGLMTLQIASFFGEKQDPSHTSTDLLRDAYCPSVVLSLTFDNTGSAEPLSGFFLMQGVRRPFSDATGGRLLGLASGTRYGFAAFAQDGVDEVLDWNPLATMFEGTPVLRRLSSEGGLRFTIPAGVKRTFVVAAGVFESGVVTAVEPMQRYYASLFRNLEDVLEFTLEKAQEKIKQADEQDRFAENLPVSPAQRLLFCGAVHSYLANSELLLDTQGRPVFVVNEGEYQMMNTLDLTVDQAFWELAYSPWTVENELDFFLARSRYRDAYGVAFCHDQGVADGFTPDGNSSYELTDLSDCFSFMSYEETLNFLLLACLYCHNAKDGDDWAKRNLDVMQEGLSSIIARDANKDGVMDVDSDRCGRGAEITTYDSLDVSLGQARNNLYLAMKAWGAFVSLSAFFAKDKRDPSSARKASQMADRISATVQSRFLPDEGYIPAVFERGNRSMIIPAIEGLVYPYFCGAPEALSAHGPNRDLLLMLRRHLLTVLKPGRCIDATSGGWKLSSTSRNTWLSKIFLNQFVAERILGVDPVLVRRDDVHASWLFGGTSRFSMTDQVDASDGKDLGSRLYPRLVTSILTVLPYHSYDSLRLPQERWDGD